MKHAKIYDRQSQIWFSRLVQHPARKRSGSILTTPEPTRGRCAKRY